MKIKKTILHTAFIAFILNLIWEFSHYSLYFDYSPINGTVHLIIASLGDFFWIFFIFNLVSIINKKITWIKKPKKKDYFLIAFFGILIAILIEIINVYFLKRWAYKESMITIFGIGLSPLIQLAVTGILSIKIRKYLRIN